MPAQSPVLPRIAVQSVGGGLLLMAFFTIMWTGIANGGLQGADHYITLILGAVISLVFIVYGIRLLLLARRYPKSTTAEDKTLGKKMGKSYGIIFGVEGLAIGLVCALLGLTHHEQFVLPAMALIIGLHFYPMARLFDRTIDYYLATWTCVIALIGGVMALRGRPEMEVMPFLGVGVAMTTISYGWYMIYYAYRLKIIRSN